jgi:hypothetical protein
MDAKEILKLIPKTNLTQWHTANEIYTDLIGRIKNSVNKRVSIVFDPATGIQKCFIAGKLVWVKHVRDPKSDNQT